MLCPMADVWDDPSQVATLASRRIGRKRGPVLRRRIGAPTDTPVPLTRKEVPLQRIQTEEKKVTVTDITAVRDALHMRRETEHVKRKGALLTFSLELIACCFLFFSVLATFASWTFFNNAPQRLPLSLPLAQNLTDTQVHGFLAVLSQFPDIAHVAFVTKEQAAFALSLQYPEHIPVLASLPLDALPENVTLTLHSSATPETLLGLFTKPAVSPLLASSAFIKIGEWEQALQAARSSWRNATFAALAVSALSLFLLVLSFRLILRLEKERRREECEVATQLGGGGTYLRSSFVFPVVLRSFPALFLGILLSSSLFFLF